MKKVNEENHLNRIQPATNIVFNGLFLVLALVAFVPIIFVFLIYHGVITTCNGYTYRMGAALLELEEPWKVLYRTRDYIFSPREYYECVGDVPNVVFPCATLTDADTGRIAVYYGAADTVTGIAFTTVDELVGYVKEHHM